MATSKRIARIVGPALMALGITEAINLDILAGAAAPVVYLNGTLLFLAGVAIVQARNRWAKDWSILVTLAGWTLLFGGLYRMVAPQAPQVSKSVAAYAVFAALFAIGGFLMYKSYGRGPSRSKPQRFDD